jgi:hypothetical protein
LKRKKRHGTEENNSEWHCSPIDRPSLFGVPEGGAGQFGFREVTAAAAASSDFNPPVSRGGGRAENITK